MIKTNPNYLDIIKGKDELIKCIKLALSSYLKLKYYPIKVIEEIINENFIS